MVSFPREARVARFVLLSRGPRTAAALPQRFLPGALENLTPYGQITSFDIMPGRW